MKYLIGLLTITIFPVTAVGESQILHPGEYLTENGWGVMQLEKSPTQTMQFSIQTLGGNAHTCELSGDVIDNQATLEGVEDGKPCIIRFTVKDQAITVEPNANQACHIYCGARAHFSGVYYKPPAGCDAAARETSRGDFKRLYDTKAFLDAHTILEKVHAQCGKYMSWRELGWVRNDLAVTRYKTGDRRGCLALLEEYAGDAKLPDHELAQLQPPADAEDYAAIVKAARTNLRLCRDKSATKK